MKIRILVMFVLALISSQVIAQENSQKMKRLSFSLGSIEAPTSFLIYHPDHATYWKANDKLLQEQLESQIKKTPGALLLVDTTNVYNHIFVYQSPQDLPKKKPLMKCFGRRQKNFRRSRTGANLPTLGHVWARLVSYNVASLQTGEKNLNQNDISFSGKFAL